MPLGVQGLNGSKREFPNWNTRARIKKVDEQGNILEGQYAFGGEAVRVSPRFQKNGQHYRIRPERPAAFFAAFLHEAGVLPTALTAEESEQEWALELLEPLWEQYKQYLFKLESPYAASDHATTPSLRVGYSFNIPQTLIEPLGSVRTAAVRPTGGPAIIGASSAQLHDVLRKKIEEMRARSSTRQEPANPAKKKA